MKIGIVGLPNVWKSTLFNALTKSYSASAENFPFCTIDPNVGIVDVKDERIDKLAELSQSQKKVYATTEFVDIAGLVKGASKGEGLGNKFLSNIRETDAIVQVLRYFQDPDVVHVEGTVDPLRDVEIINTELILADLEQLDRSLPYLQKKAKTWAASKDEKRTAEILELFQKNLNEGKLLCSLKEELSEEDIKLVKSYNFLTLKSFIYALNIAQDDIPQAQAIQKEYEEKLHAPVAVVCVKLEEEMLDMEEEEKIEFISELVSVEKQAIPTLDHLISLAFSTLGLMYYFTTWEKETKAWTIKKGSTAPQAAGAIHSDFERGFIKADVVSYDDLVTAGSRAGAREKGLLRQEGKTYVVQDWDVIIFKFNV